MNIVTEIGLKYLAKGFSVIPLGPISKDSAGKKIITYPHGGWKKYQKTMATAEEVASWKSKNLGIVTGKVSGLLVLDVDSYKEGFDPHFLSSLGLPITPVQSTAGGGKQYFFRLPKGLDVRNAVCIGAKDSGMDIRCEGGMVIVAPSSTSYGEYIWEISPFDEPLAEVPQSLLNLIIEPKTQEFPRARKVLPELVELKEGEGRNNAMASFIGKLLPTVRPERWDDEVLPMAIAVNRTHTPGMDQEELMSVYRSITKNAAAPKYNSGKEVLTTAYEPSLSHEELMSKDFPPARYVIEPFFEKGTMNMVSAPPNTWKSWFLFHFAGHIVNGTQVFDRFPTEKTKVMIVNEEDSARLVQDRLKHLGITGSSLPIHYRIAQGSKLTIEFVNRLISECKEKGIEVVMLDSLRAIHEEDENDSTSMQRVMDLLKMIARENITVIFTHHHRKKSQFSKNDDTESSRGSSAINAAISGHISLEEVNRQDERYLLVKHLKSKVGEKISPFDITIELGDVINFKYVGEHQPKEQALTEAKQRIVNELQERGQLLGRKDLVYLKIGGTTTIKEATNSLVKEGLIKSLTRKEAENLKLDVFNTSGKGNELLFRLPNDETPLDQLFDDDT